MELTQAVRIVVTDQTNGWPEEEDPTPREAIAHVRDILTVQTLVRYNDGNDQAYELVLEATEEQLEAAITTWTR